MHEPHRVSTPLELLFDLTFVVAIAAAASQLHHAMAEHHLAQGLLGYVMAFFAIWWAWMSFTWFASAYDTDDVTYRLWTMVQMVGVLLLAAGIPAASHGDFTVITIGYAVMRIGLLALWLRVAREHPDRARTARRWALGLGVVQALWLARLALPPAWLYLSFAALVVVELAIPVWSSRAGRIPWHAHHIAERYGLFTIIVLGKCVLGASNAVAGVITARGWSAEVGLVGFGSASLVLALWWVYFLVPSADALHHHRDRAFNWGYGHFTVFASLAALGASLEVVADHLTAGAAIPGDATGVMALVAGAVAVYLLSVSWLGCYVMRHLARLGWVLFVALCILVGAVLLVSQGLPLAWALLVVAAAPMFVVAAIEIGHRRDPDLYTMQ